jgi:DNA-binding NarL/FixJ family response regulator
MLEQHSTGSDALAALGAKLAAAGYVHRGVAVHDRAIRVLLVDDHTVMRTGLKALLRSTSDVDVVGEADNGTAALAAAEQLRPDVVVMDLDMPGGDGLTATRALSEGDSPVRVLVLTLHSEDDCLIAALEAGAGGYLSKCAAERDLVDAIRVVARGEVYVRPAVARLLATRMRRTPDDPAVVKRRRFDALSERERTVVQFTAEGFSGAEIGRRLGISPKTVNTYHQRIEEKLGLAHRTDYVHFALDLGLLRATEPNQQTPPRGHGY